MNSLRKLSTYSEYRPEGLALSEKGLLTAWNCLGDFREDMVLVGGLAVRHLTLPTASGEPGAVTYDVDFAIQIGSSGGQYAGLKELLGGHGFAWNGQRFSRLFESMTLYLDLLTDDGAGIGGTVQVDDGLAVSVIPGIERALTHFCEIEITGENLTGAQTTARVKVAEAGPLLVLKLNAFGGPTGRRHPKDAHDILHLGLRYKAGTQALIAAFQAEKGAENRGLATAVESLRRDFHSPEAEGSMACAAFRFGDQHRSLGETSLRIRQQCVTLAQALLQGLEER